MMKKIQVKNCGAYYVYYLQPLMKKCSAAICTQRKLCMPLFNTSSRQKLGIYWFQGFHTIRLTCVYDNSKILSWFSLKLGKHMYF